MARGHWMINGCAKDFPEMIMDSSIIWSKVLQPVRADDFHQLKDGATRVDVESNSIVVGGKNLQPKGLV
jgi:hypothetical protein